MSTFAYIDQTRKHKITANEVQNYRQDFYYCPNKECDGHLIPVHRNGLSSTYFRCLPSFPHKSGCTYKNDYSYTRDMFDEKSFNLDKFINNLVKNVDKSPTSTNAKNAPLKVVHQAGKTPAQTVCQLYHLLKNIDLQDSYNGYARRSLLCDQDSAYLYTEYLSGFKLIECKFEHYNKTDLIFRVSYTGSKGKQFLIDLHFTKQQVFRKFCENIFSIPDYNDATFVIAGTVYKSNGEWSVEINTDKQIYFPC